MQGNPGGQRVVVVTGASEGIGRAAAGALHRAGEEVVLVGRSPEKTQAAAAELGGAEHHVADFARLAEVRALAEELGRRHPRIDALLNNAGLIASSRRTETEDGHELTFQVNHLAPFLLTLLLRDSLAEACGSVVATSSAAGVRGRIALDDLDSRRGYQGFRAYATSKLENVLFTRELAARWAPVGVAAAAVHPGVVRSRWGHGGTPLVRLFTTSPLRHLMRSPERGAETLVWLATSRAGEDWESGGYFANSRPARPSPLADDPELRRGLWDRSAAMCGL
ncbi:MAG: SDR family NAD(P)-dependent oxidoreductase [Candidatus Dormibacteraceae bacterium]